MQVLHRFKTALLLMKDSLLVLKHNPRLVLFPIASGVTGLAFLAAFLGLTAGALAAELGGGRILLAVLAVCLGAIYLGTTFISVFFTAGLVHQTRDVLQGGSEPSLRSGLGGAWRVRRPLLAWAAIAATVGLVLDAIQDSNSSVGSLLSPVFGVAWTLGTFFVVPVIVFEAPSVRGMFARSASAFRDTWGETPLSIAGIGVLSFLVALPFAGPGYYLASTLGQRAVGFALIAVGVVVGAILSHTFKGIVKTALYLYATDGRLPDEFDDVDVDALADGGRDGPTAPGPTTGGVAER